jgi:hypothetical protein
VEPRFAANWMIRTAEHQGRWQQSCHQKHP